MDKIDTNIEDPNSKFQEPNSKNGRRDDLGS
jgi:hypothetical protein